MKSLGIHHGDVLPPPTRPSTLTTLLPFAVFLLFAGAVTTAIFVFRQLIRPKPPS